MSGGVHASGYLVQAVSNTGKVCVVIVEFFVVNIVDITVYNQVPEKSHPAAHTGEFVFDVEDVLECMRMLPI